MLVKLSKHCGRSRSRRQQCRLDVSKQFYAVCELRSAPQLAKVLLFIYAFSFTSSSALLRPGSSVEFFCSPKVRELGPNPCPLIVTSHGSDCTHNCTLWYWSGHLCDAVVHPPSCLTFVKPELLNSCSRASRAAQELHSPRRST